MHRSGKSRRRVWGVVAGVILAPMLSGCIFLPSMAGGESQHVGEAPTEAPSQNEPTEVHSDPGTPEGLGTSEPTDEDTADGPSLRREAVTEWPSEIPMPDGEPSPYSNTPDFYLVPADPASFDEYVEQLLAVPGAEEVDTSDSSYSIAWLRIDEYDVFVMFHEDSDQLSVSISYSYS